MTSEPCQRTPRRWWHPLFPVEIGQLRRLLRVARHGEGQRAFVIANRGLNHRPVTRGDVLNILNAPPWLDRTKMRNVGKMQWIVSDAIAMAGLLLMVWFVQILNANRIAQRDLAAWPCWFVQEWKPRALPGLVAGPRGFYVPNPLRQLNRRFFGLGQDDPAPRAPHLAVATLDDEGRAALWPWSYRQSRFWSLSDVGHSRSAASTGRPAMQASGSGIWTKGRRHPHGLPSSTRGISA